ncbi:DUF6541 family protein [Natronorubrum sulfidifaciens]|uniref:Glycosyltransferase RgtA/B/C/D-like domain-containing protein n=1 Tax=Natronorubrum sulfidifaciens JCM 14089 TaxID=1230460 RepID=L9W1A7_9EURY|nr:DUF6541 family protein [Natronorubrum sulfidifaciens]ELY42088.1 hypothetical protein C495_16108 [Natronorubrum sulfidifaciens JCM 14089]
MSSRRDLSLKLLLAVGIALLSYASVVVAMTPPASGYEISIYTAYPVAFWISIIVTIVAGQLLVLEDVLRSEPAGYWKRGYALIVAASGLLLFLPTMRYQYVMGRADTLTFAGSIDYITVNHALQPDNYYPMLHLLAATLSFLTGIEPIRIMQTIPPLFSLAFLLGTYCLIRYLFPARREWIVVLPFVSLLFVGFEHLHFTPYNMSFLLVPLVLLYCLKAQERAAVWSKIVMVVLVTALVFYHPLTGLLIVALFAIAQVLSRVPRSLRFVSERKAVPSVTVSLLVLVLLFAWYSRFDTIVLSASSIVLGRGPSQFEHATDVADRVSPTVTDLLRAGFTTYGMEALIGAATVAFLGILVYSHYRRRTPIDTYVAWFAGIFTVTFALGAVAFLVDVIFDPLRFTRYGMLAGGAIIGVGFLLLYRSRASTRSRHALRLSMYTFLLVLVSISVVLLFPSPVADTANLQVTEREVEGMDWAVTNENETMPTQDHGVLQHRHIDYLSDGTASTWELRERDTAPPDHFGYDEHATAGEHEKYDEDTYLLVTELARVENPALYPNYPDHWRHTPAEFQRLESDPTVDHVYTNGEFDTYIVRPTSE